MLNTRSSMLENKYIKSHSVSTNIDIHVSRLAGVPTQKRCQCQCNLFGTALHFERKCFFNSKNLVPVFLISEIEIIA